MKIEDPNQNSNLANKEVDSKFDFEALVRNNPDNPIFKNNFENVPNNFVSVFHYTDIANIDSLGLEGLRANFKEKFATDAIKNVDPIFDKYAPLGFSRSHANYAFPLSEHSGMGHGEHRIKLEIKVDPKKL